MSCARIGRDNAACVGEYDAARSHEKTRRQPGQDPDRKNIACKFCIRAKARIVIFA
jgi:hypothetical protein